MKPNLNLIDGLFKFLSFEKERNSLLDFIKATNQNFKDNNWHLNLICNRIEKFLAQNEKKKLGIFIPPQHGKSTIVSEGLPAFLLGKNPNIKIFGVAYNSQLSNKMVGNCKKLMLNENYKYIFPNTSLPTKGDANKKNMANFFNVVGGDGYYKGAGVGGGTGFPADLLIFDDLVKNAEEATSPKYQARNFEWAKTVAEARLDNNGKIIFIMTRWDEKDLAGMYLETERDEWDVLTLPAIRTTEHLTDSEDIREIGEALWEEKHSKEKILKVKKSSLKTFESLYQQNPKPSKDLLIIQNYEIFNGEFPNKTTYKYGLDFGYVESPTALVKIEINEERKIIYAKELIYETGLLTSKLKVKMKDLGVKSYDKIVADSAERKTIDEIANYDLNTKISYTNIYPTKKMGSVYQMIYKLKEYKIMVSEDSKNLLKEINKWQWKPDANGYPTNEEIDKFNHLTKAIIYALLA